MEKESRFLHVTLEGVVTLLLLLCGIIGGWTELKDHMQATKDTLDKVTVETTDFQKRVGAFIVRQDAIAARQEQIDKDCPRHRHGKGGEVFYCGQGPSLNSDPPDGTPVWATPHKAVPAEPK